MPAVALREAAEERPGARAPGLFSGGQELICSTTSSADSSIALRSFS